MLFAKIAGGGCDDGALGDHQLPARLQRRSDIVFADKFERRAWRGGRRGRYRI
jgi:hypothetical protein